MDGIWSLEAKIKAEVDGFSWNYSSFKVVLVLKAFEDSWNPILTAQNRWPEKSPAPFWAAFEPPNLN